MELCDSNVWLALALSQHTHHEVARDWFDSVVDAGGRGHRHGKGRRDGPPMEAQTTKQEAMGIDWMTNREINEAIPPAYTEFIGAHLLRHLRGEE